ncbi:hypothetical protein MFFC18_25850 [Mariniblastus fucicola]|uniref:Uncharacterized protein n=1 Tax=Mariniblastus fucicola TaxID=980251 RepID=A0A5B9PCR2_9BACT|nr:hypothetical protein MFFC18_25850 [Mariniblastus fucicola]
MPLTVSMPAASEEPSAKNEPTNLQYNSRRESAKIRSKRTPRTLVLKSPPLSASGSFSLAVWHRVLPISAHLFRNRYGNCKRRIQSGCRVSL